jgi:fructokinase
MFVVCGEALFDVYADGATPAGLKLDARLGGSPCNVAIGLARLQQPVAYCGALSRDALGVRALAVLQQEGVDTSLVQRLDAPTALAIVGLDAAGQPAYAFHGNGCADRLLTAPPALPPSARVLHLGSYAMVVEPVASALRQLIDEARTRCLVAYDPNVRLLVEPSLQRWRDAIAWMVPRTDVLKLSDEDLGLLYAEPAAELAAHWLAEGVAAVVVTRGAAGATAYLPQGSVAVDAPPPQPRLVDTVGAGDSFQAAMLAGLAARQAVQTVALRRLGANDWQAMLTAAARAAAITCSRPGADPPRLAELGAG